jgi:uncharacterized lipoprotein YbaY
LTNADEYYYDDIAPTASSKKANEAQVQAQTTVGDTLLYIDDEYLKPQPKKTKNAIQVVLRKGETITIMALM